MQTVTDAWKDLNQRFLLPETFVEISCRVPDVDYTVSSVTATNEASFSAASRVVKDGTMAIPHYATMERNLWMLDGSRGIIPDESSNLTPGYVSSDGSDASVTVTLSAAMASTFPGITVVWSEEFSEYPTSFNVVVKNGDTEVASAVVTDNRESKVILELEIADFDSITVEPVDWCLPDRRARLEKIILGHDITFNKGDLVSYRHEHSGDILCGELPKNMLQFSVLNVDGRWNPSNPAGLWKYLSDRQKITARYGLTVDGDIEWIPAGVFYLSDWNAPANGLEASFEARDVFEHLLNQKYDATTGTLYSLAQSAVGDLVPYVAPASNMYTLTGALTSEATAAEVIQMCANASCSSVFQSRDGGLRFKPWDTYAVGDYVIGEALSYSNPEIMLSKPLRSVNVSFRTVQSNGSTVEGAYALPTGTNGEEQTVENELIATSEQASLVAEWVKTVLESRRTISGEFRADPRLDLYDIVTVESKYGSILPVVITNIAYTYNGCFKASYSGRVIGSGVSE